MASCEIESEGLTFCVQIGRVSLACLLDCELGIMELEIKEIKKKIVVYVHEEQKTAYSVLMPEPPRCNLLGILLLMHIKWH